MAKNPKQRKLNKLYKREGVGIKYKKSCGMTVQEWNDRIANIKKEQK